MFERFTDAARRVVVLALEEARLLSHLEIGTEHLLLGLLHEGEGVAALALHALDAHLEDARAQVEDLVGHGHQRPSGHVPFTPRAKGALELSSCEGERHGDGAIDTEHLLLGIIQQGEGSAVDALNRLGVDLDACRALIELGRAGILHSRQ